jgi:chemotaxis protein methyltransferase CheR
MIEGELGFEAIITEHGLCYRRPGVPAQSAEPAPAAPDWQQPRPAVRQEEREPTMDAAASDQRATAVPADRPALRDGAAAAHVRAVWAARGPGEGLRACDQALARQQLNAELHYLRAVLLIDLGRDDDALQAARRTLYLDSGLAIAQFTLGSILERIGRAQAARRPYSNAYEATVRLSADALVPLAEGVRAGALAAAAADALARLGER